MLSCKHSDSREESPFFLVSEGSTAPGAPRGEGMRWRDEAVLCLVTQSCLTFCDPMGCSQPGSSVHGDSLGKNTGVGCLALCQGIFLTQGSNPGVPRCRQILYCISYQGSPKILEWAASAFSRGSSWSRKWTSLLYCRRILYQLSYQGIQKGWDGSTKPSMAITYARGGGQVELPLNIRDRSWRTKIPRSQ